MPNYQMYPTQVQNVQMYTQGGMMASGAVATASFDSAARFDGISQPRIPVSFIISTSRRCEWQAILLQCSEYILHRVCDLP